ncbi:SIMPL domain-containing protein [Brotaphodocola sp.]|uniref:SIMPL domain-containing protein n=1 Tax=Brotaphodocola sp. TaxID=3073577 RepID=UPI003D7EFA6B
MKRYLIATATATAWILSGCSSTIQLPDTVKVENIASARNSISVSGQEEVKVTPDIAEIRYSVYTRADSPSECQQKNTADVNAALEVLKGLGIDETSIQTSAYGLNPIHDWSSSANGEIVGYEMTTSLTVSDIPIDQAGTILSQSVSAGVNNIDSVSYSASNYDDSYQEALKGAMANARAKADAIAQADNKTVVGIIHAEENGYNPSTRYSVYESAAGSSMKSNASMDDMSVMPGQVSITAYVQVEYEVE